MGSTQKAYEIAGFACCGFAAFGQLVYVLDGYGSDGFQLFSVSRSTLILGLILGTAFHAILI